MRIIFILFFPFVTLLYSMPAYSQSDSLITLKSDTIKIIADSGNVEENYQPFQPKKSALLAVGLSALLPGAGQYYNETYWKIPVIWGLGGYWVYEWVKQNNNYKDYQDQYTASVNADTISHIGNDNLRGQRDFYRDQRDKFAWYLGALYFLNVIDAYVGANLYDFEVTPELGNNGKILMKLSANVRVKF